LELQVPNAGEGMRRLNLEGRGKARPLGAILLVLAFFAVAAQPAWAGFRDVSPGGSDATNDCSDQNHPCATIQHAIDEAEPYDWVDVAAGTYSENVTIDVEGVTLIGPSVTTRPGEPQAVVDGGSGTAIRPEAPGITIRAMTITSGPTGTGIRTSGGDVDGLKAYEDIISGGANGVWLEAGGEEDFVGFDLIQGVDAGIRLSGATKHLLSIEDNTFASIANDAVLASSGTTIEGIKISENEVPAPVSAVDGSGSPSP
jgi:hypothetical protein